jgi:hypothetical protein
MEVKRIQRNCTVCGKKLNITIDENGVYSGGHYFGEMKLPVGEGENIPAGKTKILDIEFEVVEWSGEYEEFEYWECEECFSEK